MDCIQWFKTSPLEKTLPILLPPFPNYFLPLSIFLFCFWLLPLSISLCFNLNGLSFLLYPITPSMISLSWMIHTEHSCPSNWWASSPSRKHIPVVLGLYGISDISWLLLDHYCFIEEEPVYTQPWPCKDFWNLKCFLLPFWGQAAEEIRNPASPHKYLGLPDIKLTFRSFSSANVLSHIPVFIHPMQSDRPPVLKWVINVEERMGTDLPHSHDIFLEGQGKVRMAY